MTIRRILLMACAVPILSACHLLRENCHGPEDYQGAVDAPPLHVPAGTDSPDVQNTLVIPPKGLTAPPAGPKDACMDSPPRFQHAAKPIAAGGG